MRGRSCELLRSAGRAQARGWIDPEQIRALFGLSKKAFKRAVGRLLRERLVDIDDQGYVRVLPASS